MGEAAVPSLSVRNFSGLTLGNKSLQTQQLTCPELGTTLHWYRSLPPTKLDLLEHSLELQMHPNLPKSPNAPGRASVALGMAGRSRHAEKLLTCMLSRSTRSERVRAAC